MYKMYTYFFILINAENVEVGKNTNKTIVQSFFISMKDFKNILQFKRNKTI